ncbi:MAG TPA: hypothetical protein VFS43_35770 [Polyangiaceae bacterium]|nr:hypothetical protein [Polyangiaceae bacterium]
MRCPLCRHRLGLRPLAGATHACPLACTHCGVRLVRGRRRGLAKLADWAAAFALIFAVGRALDAPSWRSLVTLAALTLLGVVLDAWLVPLEPARDA